MKRARWPIFFLLLVSFKTRASSDLRWYIDGCGDYDVVALVECKRADSCQLKIAPNSDGDDGIRVSNPNAAYGYLDGKWVVSRVRITSRTGSPIVGEQVDGVPRRIQPNSRTRSITLFKEATCER